VVIAGVRILAFEALPASRRGTLGEASVDLKPLTHV
jgi:hypothetical protein